MLETPKTHRAVAWLGLALAAIAIALACVNIARNIQCLSGAGIWDRFERVCKLLPADIHMWVGPGRIPCGPQSGPPTCLAVAYTPVDPVAMPIGVPIRGFEPEHGVVSEILVTLARSPLTGKVEFTLRQVAGRTPVRH